MSRQSEEAFRGWVETRRERLRVTAYLLCGDWFLADDLVQEMLTRVFSVWDRVSASGPPDAYARKALLRLSLDHHRRPARREVVRADLPETPGPSVDPAVDGDRDRLLRALRAVPPGQRAVLVLRYWDDLSVEQTATALGVSTGNVKSQASRGLAALRAALAAEPVTSPREAP